MSAWVRPVCGRASTRLSIFTASTSRGPGTCSPVKGDSSGPGDEPGPAPGWPAPDPELSISPVVSPAAASTAAETPAMILTRVCIFASCSARPSAAQPPALAAGDLALQGDL